MNRTLSESAAVLGIKPGVLRKRLRERRILTESGDLASHHRDKGYLFVDTRSRWNPHLHRYSYYGVVMVKEQGIEWLAKQLAITVTPTEKDTV